MDPEYYVQRKIAEAEEIGLRERRLHARMLADARGVSPPARSGRWASARSVVALLSSRAWLRGRSAQDQAASPTAERAQPATPLAVPLMGLDTGALEAAAAATAEAAINTVLEMTEAICRLPDGSTGRIAIERGANDTWAAVCVVAPQAALAFGEDPREPY